MGKHKEKSKKHKKDKKRKRARDSSSSPSSDEWVEKDDYSSEEDRKPEESSTSSKRAEWMSLPSSFLTESHLDKRRNREENKRLEREREQYNPRLHERELNPYWKDGGDGLPKFKKPSEEKNFSYKSTNRPQSSSNWKKKPLDPPKERESKPEPQNHVEILSDKELNALAAKLVKAEIMGKMELVNELKAKLEAARQRKDSTGHTEEVLLTQTDSQGHTRPVRHQADYNEPSGSHKRKRKVETHQEGQRVRYFTDDDKYSLQQMFENEKFNSVEDQNSEFMRMASKVRKNDDLDEIFSDNIRKKDGSKTDKRNRDRAINEHQRVVQSIDKCKLCLQSDSMAKHLMVSLGETAFLSLPPYEPMNKGHCLIVPIRHVTCSTLLDENEWSDIMDIRKALTQMFNARNEDVIFFETAKNLDKYPHMYIECIPLEKEEGDMAPIYFKKAIDECEAEWAQNKKLVSLKGKDVRRAVPKGLPYFFVSFGMEEGFAHVIEDQKSFPNNFAQEVIGGMLDLHHSKWRKPKYQSFDEQSKRVVEFSKEWSDFDFTKK
ncbi:CWF19-like protein 2 homolog [Tribolium madens]|uniref:CWF19-like protein 2 homolog n=1 Tax=Tribolium madens TaxID=41895 RepID=UPI001CF7508C|nr:CWF19-like protein 2 homolog [Tribolium madens]